MRQEDWHWKLKDNKTLCSWRLTLYISPLLFQADPNHRVKVAGKIIYFVYKILVKQSRVDNALILWIKKYWGTGNYARSSSSNELGNRQGKIMRRTKAPIENIFNNHKYYNVSWCYFLKTRHANRKYTSLLSRLF